MIRSLVAVATLAAAVLAAPAPTSAAMQDDDRVCIAVAKGQRGAHVDIIAEVDSDGDIWSRTVSWTPPMLDASPSHYRDLGHPGLVIRYDDAEAEAIGEMTDAIGELSSTGGPVGALRRLTLSVLMAGGESWNVEPEPSGVQFDVGGSPFRYASASLDDTDWDGDPDALLEAGGEITLSARDTMGRPVAQARFNLGAKAERDRLFRLAWRKTESMAKSGRGCAKAGEE